MDANTNTNANAIRGATSPDTDATTPSNVVPLGLLTPPGFPAVPQYLPNAPPMADHITRMDPGSAVAPRQLQPEPSFHLQQPSSSQDTPALGGSSTRAAQPQQRKRAPVFNRRTS